MISPVEDKVFCRLMWAMLVVFPDLVILNDLQSGSHASLESAVLSAIEVFDNFRLNVGLRACQIPWFILFYSCTNAFVIAVVMQVA